MDLKQLRYFTAVADAGSMTHAAAKLNIAQPPLSRQIQYLEQDLGVQLFERGSRPLKLTDAGRYFYRHAQKLLASAEIMRTMTQKLASEQSVLKLGFVSSLMYGLLPKIVHLFHKQHPHIHTELIDMHSHTQAAALKEGLIDVGFGRINCPENSLRHILLRHEPLLLAVHASHPLAKQKEGVYLKQLENENLFVYPQAEAPNFAGALQQIFSACGLYPQHMRIIKDLQLALGRTACAEGLCVAPQSVQALQLAHVHYLPLLDAEAQSPVYLSIRAQEYSEHIRSLFDCIYQVYDLEAIPYQRALF